MPHPSTVLLICAERDTAARLAAMIQAPHRKVVAAPYGAVALARAPEAQLIVLDKVDEAPDASKIVRRLKGMAQLAMTPVLCIAMSDDVDERIRLLEAGADDVMARPFLPDELQARIDALLAIHEPVRAPAAPVAAEPSRDDRPHLVSFFSPKGGVGTTTLAVNMAVAIATLHDRSVALVDLDLEWGQVATHLNVPVRFDVVELARDQTALEDPDLVRAYGEKHVSGLNVFCAPLRPDQGQMLGQEHVARLLDGLLATYDLTIVDGGSQLDERSLTLFEQSDRIVLVVTPEIPTVRAVHTLREMLAELGTPPEHQVIALNHIYEHDMLRMDDLERSLQTTIHAELVYDPVAYLKAVNEGVPVVSGTTRGAAAARLEQVALELFGGTPEVAVAGAAASAGRPRLRSPFGKRARKSA